MLSKTCSRFAACSKYRRVFLPNSTNRFIATEAPSGRQSSRIRSLSLAGCGWILSFHLGAVKVLKDEHLINEKTVIGGTSGGSIAALAACCDVDSEVALKAVIETAGSKSFLNNIHLSLIDFMNQVLPADAHERCSGRLVVYATQVWPPSPRPAEISHFESRQMLMDTIAASCFIPFYSSQQQLTACIGGNNSKWYVDGSVLALMPPVGEVCVAPRIIEPANLDQPHIAGGQSIIPGDVTESKVESPAVNMTNGGTARKILPSIPLPSIPLPFIPAHFPSIHTPSVASIIPIPGVRQPDIYIENSGKYSMQDLLKWAVLPPGPELLREFYNEGITSAQRYLERRNMQNLTQEKQFQ